MSAISRRKDPFASFKFRVDIGGMQAGFSEVTATMTETDVIEFRTGNEDPASHKISGLHKYTNVTFKRGYTNSKELWNWRKSVIDGRSKGLAGTITLLDEQRNPAAVWKFRGARPIKWAGPALNAKGADVAIEELEIGVDGLELKQRSRATSGIRKKPV